MGYNVGGADSRSRVETVGSALDRYPSEIAPWRRRLDEAVTPRVEVFAALVLAHWHLLAALASALILIGAYASPLLRHLGYQSAGQALFWSYSYICAQTPTHSYYPWGYQAAIDQRMTAIYGSFALAAAAYDLFRRRLRPLPWRLYMLLILPMAVDGFTQAFGWRESNWELRTLTGVLFAASTAWALCPRVDRVLAEKG